VYLIGGSDRSTSSLYRWLVNRDEVGIPLHRFSVKELHRMREAGVVAPRARVELLAGILVDMHRPTARELEATRRIAGVLAETFDAHIVAGEPAHPDGYATFDATLMVHDWEQLPVTAPYRLHRFTIGEFDRMVDVGVLADATRHELLDGVVLDVDVDNHERTATVAADVAARLLPSVSDVHIALQPPLELGPYSRIRLDVAVCRPRVGGNATAARGEDIVLALDVAAAPDDTERVRWPLYVRWGVTTAWIVDLDRDEVRTLRRTLLGAGFVVERRRTAELLIAN
jgi:hypothetical protein